MADGGKLPSVTIVDLGIQNILSVENAFQVIGAQTRVVTDAAGVASAGFLVMPGVGSFGAAVARLRSTRIFEAVRDHALVHCRPVLGLCLGMQLLADSSDEHGEHAGLGLIPGRVMRLKEMPPEHRVPNIGWRNVSLTGRSRLLPAAMDERSFYHVHSYHFVCADTAHVAGVSNFGEDDIAAIVHRANVFGTQFHPEKSQDAGLDLLHAVLSTLG
jgi:imidazole glycerol-phosphate synthase subunit HisH